MPAPPTASLRLHHQREDLRRGERVATNQHGHGPRVRSHCRFRNRGTDCLGESGMPWMRGGAKRRRDRARCRPRDGQRRVGGRGDDAVDGVVRPLQRGVRALRNTNRAASAQPAAQIQASDRAHSIRRAKSRGASHVRPTWYARVGSRLRLRKPSAGSAKKCDATAIPM